MGQQMVFGALGHDLGKLEHHRVRRPANDAVARCNWAPTDVRGDTPAPAAARRGW